jgi:PEP-CTERM motif
MTSRDLARRMTARHYLLAVAAAGLLVCGSSHARALTFNWSFANDANFGSVAGTVTGTIDLADNATGAATALSVTSYPTGLFGVTAAPFNIVNNPDYSIFQNSFTVASGVVTAEAFSSFNAADGSAFNLLEGFAAENSLHSSLGSAVANGGGLSGITYTLEQLPADVPEPASLAILGIGLLGLAAARKRITPARTKV